MNSVTIVPDANVLFVLYTRIKKL